MPRDKGANAGSKLAALVAGMAAGADSIEDMGVLRHGAMGKVLDRPYAPSLGSFLRTFTFGHVRQIDAVASHFTLALAERTGLLERWVTPGRCWSTWTTPALTYPQASCVPRSDYTASLTSPIGGSRLNPVRSAASASDSNCRLVVVSVRVVRLLMPP